MVALFIKAWLMVSLVALNTVQVSRGHYGPAVAVGFCISLLWWENSSKKRCDKPWAGVVYASGAALGTATGMIIGHYWG